MHACHGRPLKSVKITRSYSQIYSVIAINLAHPVYDRTDLFIVLTVSSGISQCATLR